ncbi:hypothetical protein ACHIPZ_13855 [Antrihabitans sp. NCIMB 15449]|uniref:Phage tail protein n=1 Tax=Antrihabitans spumae TaxID=3373370 RepID=A0ABW7JMS1_9NOCA
MTREADNVKIYENALVYLSALSTRPAIPADIDTAMGATWIDAGLLDGDSGFAEERTSDEKEHFAWNQGLIKVSGKNYGLKGTFSPLEDNEVIRELVWPGSTDTKIKLPKPVYRWMSFETTTDLAEKERRFTTKRARLWVPKDTRNESDITKWEVMYQLFADSAGDVFDKQIAA